MGEILVIFIRADDLGMTEEEEGDGTTSRAHIHRLPQTVEHKNLPV